VTVTDGVVLALFDMEAHRIDHVVIYEQTEGTLTRLVGSFDAGPFSTNLEACQWLVRTLTATPARPVV